MDALETMRTARNIRHLENRPVDDGLIDTIVEAATWAPSPGNSQGWDFVVVRDSATKAALSNAIGPVLRDMRGALDPHPNERAKTMHAGADHLIDSLADVPVLIFVCGSAVYPPKAPMEEFIWSALYPATQNLRFAARALGLAAPMTTAHLAAEPFVRELLAIPENVKIAAMIPVGWPSRSFGPLRRRPATEVTHHERWGGSR